MSKVIAVIGAGSVGQARARRAGAGKHVLLADLRRGNADAGFQISTKSKGLQCTAPKQGTKAA